MGLLVLNILPDSLQGIMPGIGWSLLFDHVVALDILGDAGDRTKVLSVLSSLQYLHMLNTSLYCRPSIVDWYHRAIDHLGFIRSQKCNTSRNIIDSNDWHRCTFAVL